jgi:uncharacterized membrane protein HdeD (DUF308 family)
MRQVLSRAWWMLALHGAAALLFGILALAWPGVTLIFLVALFAAYIIVSGIAGLVGALQNRSQPGWWLVLLFALLNIAAGVIAVLYPELTALVLVLVIGVNAILAGVIQIVMAVRLRKEIEGEWLLGLAGLVSVLFGAFVVIFHGSGALALVWLIAAHAIVVGTILLILAVQLRRMRTSVLAPT